MHDGRRIVVLICVLFVAACGGHADSGGAGSDQAASSAPPSKPWQPLPFDSEADVAVVNNLDPFFTAFETNSKRLVKGEFETTEEHAARQESRESFGVFRDDLVYALEVARAGAFDYDADSEKYSPLIGSRNECGSLRWHWNDKNQVICEIGSVIDGRRRYEGENAFGRKASAEDIQGRHFGLVLDRQSAALNRSRTSGITGYTRRGECPVPRAQAQEMKHRLAFAYLVRISSPQARAGEIEFQQATISDPEGRYFERVGIESEIIGYVCYDNQTKAILHKGMF